MTHGWGGCATPEAGFRAGPQPILERRRPYLRDRLMGSPPHPCAVITVSKRSLGVQTDCFWCPLGYKISKQGLRN